MYVYLIAFKKNTPIETNSKTKPNEMQQNHTQLKCALKNNSK